MGGGEGDALTFRGGGALVQKREICRGWHLCIKGGRENRVGRQKIVGWKERRKQKEKKGKEA